ncbi:MAG TPA: protein-L-isoaspartate O-methyltransferase, partial [Aliiroseovarius sp.]|nr:protein-L-isoaspartate O-methyltransferase [Aliiroseovarius sp.]
MTDFVASRTTMVDTQIRPSEVTRYPIIEAMLAVPREAFVPDAW